MKLLITGASGFTGRHLLRELDQEFETPLDVFSLYQSHEPEVVRNSTNLQCDLTDYRQISGIAEEIRPDLIIHLAAQNRGQLEELLIQNVVSTGNLFEAVHQAGLSTRVLAVGSSAEYGYQGDAPINETAPLRPMSMYGISKAAASHLVLFYHRKYQIPAAIVRPFNLIGPGQSDAYFIGKLLGQMQQYDRGEIDQIQLKNADSERDFIDVRDAVKAYLAVLLHPDFDAFCSGKVFNAGSGRSTSVLEVFRLVKEISGKEYPFDKAQSSEKEMIPVQICDNSNINAVTTWKPEIALRKSLRDMILFKSFNAKDI